MSDFDKRVNDNKTAAEEALKKIPLINATIQAASQKTRQAEAALGNAAADAREAKTKAEEAERIASNVQKVKTDSAPCCPVSAAVGETPVATYGCRNPTSNQFREE